MIGKALAGLVTARIVDLVAVVGSLRAAQASIAIGDSQYWRAVLSNADFLAVSVGLVLVDVAGSEGALIFKASNICHGVELGHGRCQQSQHGGGLHK